MYEINTIKTKKQKKTIPIIHGKKNTDGQKVWDDLLKTQESDALLTILISESKKNESEGKFEEEDW